MKNYKVTVTMMQPNVTNKSGLSGLFTKYIDAYNHYAKVRDTLNIDREIVAENGTSEPNISVGGIGYDYRVELEATEKEFPAFEEIINHMGERLYKLGWSNKDIEKANPSGNMKMWIARDRATVIISELEFMGFITEGEFSCDKTSYRGDASKETNVLENSRGEQLSDLGWNDVALNTYNYFKGEFEAGKLNISKPIA